MVWAGSPLLSQCYNMLLVSPTLSQIQRAKKEARELGVLKNSATNGGGNMCGILGEILFHSYYGGKRVPKSCRTHDVTLKNGVRVDVKSQITQNVTSSNAGNAGTESRFCAHCGPTYIYGHSRQKFCSDACRIKNWKERTGRELINA